MNPVTIPLVNTNEPEALLVSLEISAGQQVAVGDILCTLETTKAAADVIAETAGYVTGLRFAEGDTVRAGDILCYLAESPDAAEAQFEPIALQTEDVNQKAEIPPGLRITQPALSLAREHEIDLARLPTGPLVTEKTVRSLLEESVPDALTVVQSDFDPAAILIFGAGGHGKTCLDLLRTLKVYRVVGFVDDGRPAGEQVMGVPVLGGADVLPKLRDQGVRLAVNAVGGISNLAVRIQVFDLLKEAGFVFPTLAHPTAVIETSATLAPGVQIFSHAYVGSEAKIGFGSIINTGAIISHDCQLGNYVNLSPGATLAGEVVCGDRVLVGMRATVNLQANIGAGVRIGNGATVKSDVPANGMVRAGGIWPT